MKKIVLTLTAILAMTLACPAWAADKNWKDRAEYDLYNSIVMDQNPATRLQNLDKWKSMYPMSEYAPERLIAYLVTYQQLMKHREAIDTSTEILKNDPNNLQALTEIVGYTLTLVPADPKATLSAQNKADLDLDEKTARYIVANIDMIYDPAKKPANVPEAQWTAGKPVMQNFAQFQIARIALIEKDNAKAEAELSKTLQMDPTNGQASYMLAGVLLGQQKTNPEKMPLALYEYARAATYDGPNALDANTRKQVDAFLGKAYNTFHGSAQGLPELKTQAKAAALPASGFEIKSTVKIAEEKAAADKAARDANPMLALWNDIKGQLTGDGGQAYFDSMVKDAGLPGGAGGVMKFTGKLVSTTPDTRPKELVLAISGDMPEVTLKLDEPLPGKMDPGGEISFSGTAKEFTKDPFMLTFEVAKEDLTGWTGTGPAAPARPGAKKKVAPKKAD